MDESVYLFVHSIDCFILATLNIDSLSTLDQSRDKKLNDLLNQKPNEINKPEFGTIKNLRYAIDNARIDNLYYVIVDDATTTPRRLLALQTKHKSVVGFVAVPINKQHVASAAANLFVSFIEKSAFYKRFVKDFKCLNHLIGGQMSREDAILFTKSTLFNDELDIATSNFFTNQQLKQLEEEIENAIKLEIIALTNGQTSAKLAQQFQNAFYEVSDKVKTGGLDFVKMWIDSLDVDVKLQEFEDQILTAFIIDDDLRIEHLKNNFLYADLLTASSELSEEVLFTYFDNDRLKKEIITSNQQTESWTCDVDKIVLAQRRQPGSEILKLFIINNKSLECRQLLSHLAKKEGIGDVLIADQEQLAVVQTTTRNHRSNDGVIISLFDGVYNLGSEIDYTNALIKLLNTKFENIQFDEKYQIEWPINKLCANEKEAEFSVDNKVEEQFNSKLFEKVEQIMEVRGKKAKKAIAGLVNLLMDHILNKNTTQGKTKRSKRGEHVINNSVLSLHRDIIDLFIRKQFNCSFADLKFPKQSELYQDYHKPLLEDISDNIQNKMVVHIPVHVNYLDANSLIYGVLVKIIRESAVEHMFDLYNGKTFPGSVLRGSQHKAKITATVKQMNLNCIYVDQTALQFWLTQGTSNWQTYEKCRKAVNRMFENLYNQIKFWVREFKKFEELLEKNLLEN